MNSLAFDKAIRAIRLRESYVLGLVWLNERDSIDSEADYRSRAEVICKLERMLGEQVGESLRYVLASDSIDEEIRAAVRAGSRTSRYSLLNWRRDLGRNRLILLDLHDLDPDMLEPVSLLTDGMVAIVDEVTPETVEFVTASKKRGVTWLGYWQLQEPTCANAV